jgi:hypothetical protein
MGVTEGTGGNPRHEIEVFFAVAIPHPTPSTAFEGDRETPVSFHHHAIELVRIERGVLYRRIV